MKKLICLIMVAVTLFACLGVSASAKESARILELAEKFEVRAQERDVIKSPEKEETREGEHEEKPSTLAKLKAEKEKIAKQPKKDPVDKHKSKNGPEL